MKITPFDRYRDKNGKTYQVLTTAISLATEKEEVVVQQLYGHYINISIPEDKFLRIFTKIDDRENEKTPEPTAKQESQDDATVKEKLRSS